MFGIDIILNILSRACVILRSTISCTLFLYYSLVPVDVKFGN